MDTIIDGWRKTGFLRERPAIATASKQRDVGQADIRSQGDTSSRRRPDLTISRVGADAGVCWSALDCVFSSL